MKILKYILGIVAILILVYILLGVFKPEVAYEDEILVDKPVTESWAVIQDEEKLSEWLPGFQKMEHISGTPGTVGAVADVYFDTNGQKMTIRETITGLVPNESISMSYTSDFMTMDYDMAMSSDNGKTKIQSSTKVRGNGLFSRSMVVLMAGSFRSQEESNLTNLKKTIEQNTKDYSQEGN